MKLTIRRRNASTRRGSGIATRGSVRRGRTIRAGPFFLYHLVIATSWPGTESPRNSLRDCFKGESGWSLYSRLPGAQRLLITIGGPIAAIIARLPETVDVFVTTVCHADTQTETGICGVIPSIDNGIIRSEQAKNTANINSQKQLRKLLDRAFGRNTLYNTMHGHTPEQLKA